MFSIFLELLFLPFRLVFAFFCLVNAASGVANHLSKKEYEDRQRTWDEVDNLWYGE